MRFLPKNICEKLVKIGCKTDGFAYYGSPPNFPNGVILYKKDFQPDDYLENIPYLIPAFTLEDFVGTHEQAKENRKIIFPDKFCIDCNKIAEQDCKAFHLRQEGDYYFLNEIVNSKDWVEFISEVVDKKD